MKSEIGSFYKLKSWVDAKDGQGIWRMGRIKKRAKEIVKVDFDGWSDRWKQSYCTHSKLIAPFRMHSKGYTGQPTVALREWDFNEDRLKLYDGKIDLLFINDLGGFSPVELTLFMRGDLFVLVDCLLTYTYSNPSSEPLRVMDFLNHVLDLCLKWLDVAPSRFAAARLESEDTYLYDTNTAIYKSGYEVLEMLANILGLDSRTSRFFKKYEGMIGNKNLAKEFASKNGFKYINKLIDSNIPIEDIWHFLVKFPKFFSKCSQYTSQKFLPDLAEALLNRIEAISQDSFLSITEDSGLLELFYKRMDKQLEGVYSEQQKQSFLNALRLKLKIQVKPSSIPAAPMRFSQIEEAPRVHTTRVESSTLQGLRDLIEEKHQQCINLLLRKVAELGVERVEQDSQLDDVFLQRTTCDRQEMAVLGTVEFLLAENNPMQALRVIRWRKKILRIAAMNGWEMAEEIARQTYSTLDVEAGNFLEVGALKKMISAESLEFSDHSDSSMVIRK